MGTVVSKGTVYNTNKNHVGRLKGKIIVGGKGLSRDKMTIKFLNRGLDMKVSVKGRRGLYLNKRGSKMNWKLYLYWQERGGLNT